MRSSAPGQDSPQKSGACPASTPAIVVATRTSGGTAVSISGGARTSGTRTGSWPDFKGGPERGKVGRIGFQERAAFIDTLSYILEVNSPNMGHLQQLLRPDGAPQVGTSPFNSIGIDLEHYEGPYETRDGFGEATLFDPPARARPQRPGRRVPERDRLPGRERQRLVRRRRRVTATLTVSGPARSPKRWTDCRRTASLRTGWRTGRTP